jgi:voltage-gated potassium channel
MLLKLPALLLVVVLVYGVVGYMQLEDWSFPDALYMTVITLGAVGFREVRPLDQSGKAFTVSLVILGVTVVVFALSAVARSIAEGQLGERARRRRMQRRVDALKDHFVICAYGRVGRTAARELEAEGVPFVVVDRLEELEEKMTQDGVLHIIGDPTSEPVLKTAGIERARALICAMDSDAANVYVTLTARSLKPDIFIVARSSEALAAERLYKAGADRVISPYVSSGRHMAVQALRPRVLDYLEVGLKDDIGLRLEELQIEATSPLVGRTLTEVCGKAIPLAVRHSSGEVVAHPDADHRLEPGDLLVLLGERDALRPVEE